MSAISVSKRNPHYLEYRGSPVVLITSAEHYGSVLNRDFDYVRYLETLCAWDLTRRGFSRESTASCRAAPKSLTIRLPRGRKRFCARGKKGARGNGI